MGSSISTFPRVSYGTERWEDFIFLDGLLSHGVEGGVPFGFQWYSIKEGMEVSDNWRSSILLHQWRKCWKNKEIGFIRIWICFWNKGSFQRDDFKCRTLLLALEDHKIYKLRSRGRFTSKEEQVFGIRIGI